MRMKQWAVRMLAAWTMMVAAGSAGAGNLLPVMEAKITEAEKVVPVGDFLAVDPAKAYRLSGRLRGAAGKVDIGLMLYDSGKREIGAFMLNALPGTETALTRPVKQGDCKIEVADASKWLAPQQGKIAVFNAAPDLSDLPNRNIEYYVDAVTRGATGWTVTFSRPLEHNYPAGTMVRQHRDGGRMTFGMPLLDVEPEWTDFSGTAFQALPSGAPNDHMWSKGVFAKLLIRATAVPVEFDRLKLEPLSGHELKMAAEKRVLTGRDLKNSVRPFKQEKILPCRNAIEVVVAGYGGFYQQGLDWNTAEIRQLEFTVMSRDPGYWQFAYNTVKDGRKVETPSNLIPVSAIPDGAYHTIIVPLDQDPRWQGVLTNWELSWTGNESGTIGLSEVRAAAEANRIPGAAEPAAGKAVTLDTLLPRGQYTLRWEGGKSPGTTLKFFDANLREIPGSAVNLPAGGETVDFTAPDTLIRSTVELAGTGAGHPVLTLKDWRRRFSPPFGWRGQWLWHQHEWGPFHANVWFEKDFELDQVPERAMLATIADDTVDVYVNGTHAGHASPFWVPGRFDITRWLKPGKNRLDFRVYNGTQNAGLVVDCYVKLKDRELFIVTDKSWRCDPTSNLADRIPERIDRPVVTLGDPATTTPWAGMIGYRYVGPAGKLIPIKLEPGKMTVRVEALPPAVVDRLNFMLVSDTGVTRNYALPVTPGSGSWKMGATITLSYPLPHVESGHWKLSLADDYVMLGGDPVLAAIYGKKTAAPALAQASFTGIGERPFLLMNGRKIDPVFWHGVRSVTKDRLFELDVAASAGIENFRMTADFYDFWKGENKYDFSVFDATIDYLLSVCPDAVFSIQLYAHMPEWWLAANPDDTTAHYGNHPRFRDRDKQALASQKWLTDAEAPLKALIDHIRSRSWADRVWGVLVAENGNGEWFWGNSDENRDPSFAGFSPADLATFRAYLKEKYRTDASLAAAWGQPGVRFATAAMPDPNRAAKGRIGVLLDVRRDRQLIDWFEFRNRALGEAIIHFGKFIKQQTGNKWLVGAYYGYHIELAENHSLPLQTTGHNAFLEVAKSPYVDFVQAPSRYTYRKTGMADAIMQPWDTFNFHGKGLYVEQDVRTAYGPSEGGSMNCYVGLPSTGNESAGHLNRGFGMALATGTMYYWFDISMGALYEKALLDVLAEQLKVYRELPPVQGTTPVEVAIVSDRDSIYYTRTASPDGVFNGAISGLFRHFNELAVPFHCCTIADLLDDSITVPPHKFYIMLPTLILSGEQRRKLVQRFGREKAAVLWLYAAGPDTPEAGPSAAQCGDFLGLAMKMETASQQPEMTTTAEFGNLRCVNYNTSAPWFYPVSGFQAVLGSDAAGKPMLVKTAIDGATHYFSTLMNLPMPLYAGLMERAGVRCYADTFDDPLWIGNDVLFLHAKTGGVKHFRLPPGTRLRAIVGPFEGVLEAGKGFTAVAGQTYGFLVEPLKKTAL